MNKWKIYLISSRSDIPEVHSYLIIISCLLCVGRYGVTLVDMFLIGHFLVSLALFGMPLRNNEA